MAEALYGQDGYYTRRPRLGGAAADFFTSPELHPAFGALLGRFARIVWQALGCPSQFDIVEYGPGSGALCRDLLDWARHTAPDFAAAIRYRLVELSEPLQAAQRHTLADASLLNERVSWSASPSTAHCPLPTVHSGLILANELVDALPVHSVVVRDGVLRERYVTLDGDTFSWIEDEPSMPEIAAYFERLGLLPGEGCLAEVNLAGVDWLEQTAATLDRGALLVLDYGYPALDLFSPSRRHGTLLTYHAHTLGSDPLVRVGYQDITAHVDFTSLARAGERAGLETVGLISQAALLRRLGLDAYVQRVDASDLSAWDHEANRRALLALVDPEGLGRVQALLQTRCLETFDPFAVTSTPALDAWLPTLRPGQMRLPGPAEAEGFVDLEAQWRELFADDAEATDADDTGG
jgi:SAM-dependent MidA family methyltransferase